MKHKIDLRFVLLAFLSYLATLIVIWALGYAIAYSVQDLNPAREAVAAAVGVAEALILSVPSFAYVLFFVVVPWYWRMQRRESIIKRLRQSGTQL